MQLSQCACDRMTIKLNQRAGYTCTQILPNILGNKWQIILNIQQHLYKDDSKKPHGNSAFKHT